MKFTKPTYFIDLDGTLFDTRGIYRVSLRNQSAILIMKNFANVVLSTGRSYSDYRVKQTIKLLRIDDIICSSGAEIYINHKLASFIPIEAKSVQNIVNFANSRKLTFVVYDNDGEHAYLRSNFSVKLAKMTVSKWMKTIQHANKFSLDNHKGITKISFLFKTNFFSRKTAQKLLDTYPNTLSATTASNNYVIEITDIKTNKAKAAQEYASLKGIDLSNSVHIGDSNSDACLKGYVGKLVAMGNATKELKEIADEIAPKNKNGGIYKYLVHSKTNIKK